MSSLRFVRGVMYRAAAPAALVALATLAAACGEPEEALPQEASETPTASASPDKVTATPTPDAAPTAAPDAQASAEAGGKAPDGCSPTELAYVDPDGRFAFCHLADMQLTRDDAPTRNEAGVEFYGIGVGVRYPLEGDADPLSVGLGWQISQSDISGRPCGKGEFGIQRERVEPYVIYGHSGLICFQDRYHPDEPDVLWRQNMRAEVLVTDGGYIVLDMTYAPGFTRDGLPAERMIARFLDSLVLY